MRTVVLLAWLMLPVLAGAYHYGPGQQRLVDDEVALTLRQAEADAHAGRWSDAVERYEAALTILPTARVAEARRVRLELAKARLHNRQLPEAHDELLALVDEAAEDDAGDPRLLAEARAALANSRYYLTWLMRLEGRPRDEWEPEIEASRQAYRLLAEDSIAAGDETSATKHREDLEATIRLARMDLSDLQALPLPSQCKGCCSGQCKGRGQCKKPGKGPGGEKKPEDARGASSGPPPDGRGS